MMANDFPDEAGRLSYLAGLNAARAYVFELTGKVAKTHSGTHSEFSRLLRDDLRFGDGHRRFLGQHFAMKAAADYGDSVSSGSDAEAAVQAMTRAGELIAAIEAAMTAPTDREDMT